MTAKAQGALDRLADAARLEAARDAMRTAPTPERRVGEERVEQLIAMGRKADEYGHGGSGAFLDVVLDLRDERAAVTRLTAEVERLTKEKAEAVAIATDAANEIGKCCDSAGCDVQNWCSHAAPFRVRLAALSHRPPCLLAQAATE